MSENLVNRIIQKVQLGQTYYLVCRSTLVRTILNHIVFGGGYRSFEINRGKRQNN